MTIASVTRSPGGSQPSPAGSATTSTTTTGQPGPEDVRGIRKAGKFAAGTKYRAGASETKLVAAAEHGSDKRPSLADAIRERADGARSGTRAVSSLADRDHSGVRKPGIGDDQPAAGGATARASFGFDLPDLPDVVDDVIDALEDVIEDGNGGGGIRKPG